MVCHAVCGQFSLTPFPFAVHTVDVTAAKLSTAFFLPLFAMFTIECHAACACRAAL
jgi:hypothetical protein